MKVQSTNQSGANALQSSTAPARQNGGGAAGGAGAASSGADAGGDVNVSLSGLSSQLSALAASGSADIDTATVESIKSAIRNGTLQIDPGKIADGVLETARNLLQTPSQDG